MTIPSADLRQRANHSISAGLLLGSLLFVPGALGYLFEASSFAPGTAVAAVAAIVLAVSGQGRVDSRDVQSALAAIGITTFVILAHLLLAIAIINDSDLDLSRALLSLVLLGIIILSVPAVREILMAQDCYITPAIKIICALFVVIVIFSIAKIQPETLNLGEKPTFPYTEPSFVGFSLPAVLLFTTLRSSLLMRVIWVAVFLILAYLIGNFTIIAACVLVAATVLPLSWLGISFAVMIIGSASLDLSYYTDRLDFDWANSTNLSALVYVQGWQMLGEALHKSHTWGLGFQQLGIGYTNVPATIRINALLGRDANLQDGGFILSKLGSEFGIIGLFLAASYIYVAGWSFLKLRAVARQGTIITDAELFARSCVLGYIVEGVVRGTNYFTGTFVLLLAGLAYLARQRSARRLLTITT